MKLQWNKAIRIIGVLVLLNLAVSPAWGSDYLDSFAREEIDRSLADELVVLQNDLFEPDRVVSRGAFIRMVNRYFGLHRKAENQFSDVGGDHPYYDDFLIAREAGYVQGFEDGTVQPDRPLTRQEAVTLGMQLMHYRAESEDYPALTALPDYGQIAQWSKAYMDLAVSRGYLNLYPDGTLRPVQEINREEAVYFLARLTGRHVLDSGTVGSSLEREIIRSNLTVFAPDVTLENLEIRGDLIITDRVEGGNIVLRDTDVQGSIVVRGAGNVTVTLWGSRAEEVQTFNYYGLTIVRRDSESVIGNYLEETALRLDVVEEPAGHLIDTSPLRNPLVLLVFVGVLVVALLGFKQRDEKNTYFVVAGQIRRLRLGKITRRTVREVINPNPETLEVNQEEGILVLTGLEPGQSELKLVLAVPPGKPPKELILHILVINPPT